MAVVVGNASSPSENDDDIDDDIVLALLEGGLSLELKMKSYRLPASCPLPTCCKTALCF